MNSSKVADSRNSYDNLANNVGNNNSSGHHNNSINNDYDSLVNDERSLNQESGLYDLYDFHDMPIEDQLMIAHGMRPNDLLDDDTEEGNKHSPLLSIIQKLFLNQTNLKN